MHWLFVLVLLLVIVIVLAIVIGNNSTTPPDAPLGQRAQALGIDPLDAAWWVERVDERGQRE